MPKAAPIINAFNAGELSPLLEGRTDLQGKYENGCSIMENFTPKVQGPAAKRPGLRFVREVKASADATRLIPFEYSTDQAYILEFGNQYIRFFMDGGVILSGGSPYEVSTDYLSSEVGQIQFAQSADAMYLAHPNHPPMKLIRTAHDSWSISEVDFDWPAFGDENVTSVTIRASAVSGSGITLTASSAIFAAGHVGTYFRIADVISSKYNLWDVGQTVAVGNYRIYDGNLYQAVTGGTTGQRPPIHTDGNESDGGVTWYYINNGSGYAKCTGYTSATVITADVVVQLPPNSVGGLTKWTEASWSDFRGWPKTVCFFEDRLWFAGSENRPQTLWASVSGDYENHQYGSNDDDALNYTINSQEVNVIEWMVPGKILAVGTSGSEFMVSASSADAAITPTNVRVVPQTSYGSAAIRPPRIGNAIPFIQRSGKKIRELAYVFENDSYVAPNMTILSEHVTGDGVVAMDYQQEPDQIVWMPRSDGVLVGMTYERTEDVTGWHRQPIAGTDAEVESVAVIPHWNEDADSVWFVVKRTVNGSTVRYIEYMEKYLKGIDAFFIDSGLTYDGAAVTTISGLDHLEGEIVSVVTDGSVHPDRTVSSGEISLQAAASKVHVGLSYYSTVGTMNIDAGAYNGTSQGKSQRIESIIVRLHETGPGLFYGPSTDDMDEVHMRRTTHAMDAPVPLFTGDTEILPWPGGYEVGQKVVLQHRSPLPCTIIAIMPQIVTYDR